MPGNVFANGRSVLHKDDGGTQIAGVPDVCKTPSPGGPVPVPYPNLAMSSDLADGTKKVKIQGAMAAHKSAKISKSSGDEAGTAGGVVSNVNRGKMAFSLYSMDVKLEGKNAVRFADLGPGNGNSYNDMYPAVVGGVHMVAYGDDSAKDVCDKCDQARPPHRMWATDDCVAACKKWMDRVEQFVKDIVDARAAWVEGIMAQLANAEFSDPGGSNHKLVKVDTQKKLQTDCNWKIKVHSSELAKLAAVNRGLKELSDLAATALPPVKHYKDSGRYLPTQTRMFGVCLCKCRSKPGKQAQAYAGISGDGSSTTGVLDAFDYAGYQAKEQSVEAAAVAVDALVADPKYGRPCLATIKDELERQNVTALLDAYDALTASARKAMVVTNAQAQLAPNNAGHFFAAWTLEAIAAQCIHHLNNEDGRIYDWHLPAHANLGPPPVQNVAWTSTPNAAGGTDTAMAWTHTPGKPPQTWNSGTNDSNTPFCCAAPKVVELCQSRGHVPESLCEMVYLGPKGKPITVNPRTASTADYNNPAHYQVKSQKVDHKEVAAHCDTCQEIIPLMVCDKNQKDCP
ncbi:MAG: DUF4150 domain-containing protein [Polyangiaceae bacterium]